MKSRKLAFTLAELMIVLSVIGILSAILLPVAFQSTPDKDILKFKKANNTLATAVRELVTSGKYYKYGSLAYPVIEEYQSPYAINWWGALCPTDTDAPNYFCNSLADIISVKEKSCKVTLFDLENVTTAVSISGKPSDENRLKVDAACPMMLNYSATNGNGLDKIVTIDNVTYYLYGTMFGRENPVSGACAAGQILVQDEAGKDICIEEDGTDILYSAFCIDIDGIEGPIKPFGYGIRTDGKIKAGARADWWLKRDITKKETDCCPKALNDAGLCDTNDTVCAS